MLIIEKFINDCIRSLYGKNPLATVKEIMVQLFADYNDIDLLLGRVETAEKEPGKYIPLYKSEDLTILKVYMSPLLLSPVHNHLTWAVTGTYKGQENNIFYDWTDGKLVEEMRHEVKKGEVYCLDSGTIHRIANPLNRQSCSLQVYGGSLDNPARSLWNPVTLIEEPFTLPDFLRYERDMMLNSDNFPF
jgi:predicted metal-dependent enzyme (double-stranded beta helix superfamily)